MLLLIYLHVLIFEVSRVMYENVCYYFCLHIYIYEVIHQVCKVISQEINPGLFIYKEGAADIGSVLSSSLLLWGSR